MSDSKPSGKDDKPPQSARPAPRDSPPSGLEAHIGDKLKAMYDEVVAQPIPDRLLDLLNRLDEKAEDK